MGTHRMHDLKIYISSLHWLENRGMMTDVMTLISSCICWENTHFPLGINAKKLAQLPQCCERPVILEQSDCYTLILIWISQHKWALKSIFHENSLKDRVASFWSSLDSFHVTNNSHVRAPKTMSTEPRHRQQDASLPSVPHMTMTFWRNSPLPRHKQSQ